MFDITKLISPFLLHLLITPSGFRVHPVRSLAEAADEQATLDFVGLCQQHGRRAEEHKVTTDDGYILTFFRVPPNSNTNGRSIFLQHGLSASADVWALFGPDRSLAMLLSDEGYDVWIGNVRGNVYSRRHISLSPDDSNFWDFSIDELGLLDLPAMLDYALRMSGTSRITYIGHSQGTTLITVLLSEKTEYNDKVDLVILYSPACYFATRNPPRLFGMLAAQAVKAPTNDGTVEVAPRSTLSAVVWNQCKRNLVTMQACLSALDVSNGYDRENISEDTWGELAKYTPSGCSLKNILHFVQNVRTGKMLRYDHSDKRKNLERYGQLEPPEYDPSKITSPIAVYQGGNDMVTTTADVDRFVKKLSPGVLHSYDIFPGYNHASIVFADNYNPIVYSKLKATLREFHNNW